MSLRVFIQHGWCRDAETYRRPPNLGDSSLENTETAEVLLLAVYHTVISLQNLTTNEHVPNLSDAPKTDPSNVEMTWK